MSVTHATTKRLLSQVCMFPFSYLHRGGPHLITPILCAPLQGILLVFDMTNEESFLSVRRWMDDIKEVGSSMFASHPVYVHSSPFKFLRRNKPKNSTTLSVYVFSYQAFIAVVVFVCFQYAESEVKIMIVANKYDLASHREVSRRQGEEVRLWSCSSLEKNGACSPLFATVCLQQTSWKVH